MRSKTTIILFLVLLIIGLVVFLFIDKIPPDALTRTNMVGIEQRIRKYVEDNGKLPLSLSQLQKRPGYDNSIKDGWGNTIIYYYKGSTVFLVSYGKDGKIGGEDENADISVHFTLKTRLSPPA